MDRTDTRDHDDKADNNDHDDHHKTRDELLIEIGDLRDAAKAHTSDMDAVIGAVADPVVVYDRHKQVVWCNAAFRAVVATYSQHPHGATLQAQAEGLALHDLAGVLLSTAQSPQNRMLHGETLSGPSAIEASASSVQGEEVWWSVTGAPLRADDGTISGAVVVLRDITARKQAEAELRRANERFLLAERAANGFVYEWDVRTGKIYRSAGLERLLGYRPEEVAPTWEAWAQLVYPGDWQVSTDAEARAYVQALTSETLESEYRVRHRDGHYRTVAEYALLERDPTGTVTRLIGQVHDISERKAGEEALQRAHDELEQQVTERTSQLAQANQQLRRLSHRILEVQESERRLIAQELHDEIGQQLTGAKMLLDGLDEHLRTVHVRSSVEQAGAARADEQEQSVVGQIRALRALMGETLEDVRSLSLELRPAVLDSLGLLAALQWLFQRYTAQTGVQVTFATDGLERRLPRQVETAVYRIVQEALTNVARYANVSSVTVQLYVTEERVLLYIVDSGVGFAAEEAVAGGDSTGLASMRERANLLGGTLTIDSLPGEGTTISAELPILHAIETAVAQEVGQDGDEILDEQTRHRARDELRDHARDQWRDAARDARRDTQRDALRDMTRDADRDRARDAAHDAARDASRDASPEATRDALYDNQGTRKESKP